MSDEILDTVTEVIAGNLGIDAAGISSDSRLAEDLGADSLDAVELIMSLEDKFGIEFDGDDATGIETVGDIVKAVRALTGA